MRLIVLVAAALLVAGSATQQQQQPQQGAPPEAQQDSSGCGTACAHYLNCKGIQDANLYGQCTAECQMQMANGQITPQQAAMYAQLDCVTAISVIEEQQGGGQGGQPQEQGGTCNADCHGCVWDGSTCYYHAASGAGVVSECAACCCAPGGPAKRWD